MYIRILAISLLVSANVFASNPAGKLTLSEALALALKQSPQLKSFDWDIRAAEARIVQAKLSPNPQLIFNAENLPGSGPYRDGDLMENTLQLSQLVELGGKRQARVSEATSGVDVAGWAYQVQRVEVLKTTAQAFVAVLAAQRQVQLAEETATLAEKVTPMTQKRVEAGKANAVEVMRSNVAVASAKIELEQARRTLATTRAYLASQWGAQTATFAEASGNLESLKAVPAFPTLVEKVRQNPEIVRWTAEREKRLATLSKEKALAKPDITVFGGPRVVGKGDDVTLTLGVSIPLAFKNRNQGAIAEAEALVAKTDSERKSSEIIVFTQLNTAYQVLQRASKEVDLLTKEVLPGAQQAEEALVQGYEAGRFTQLEVLDARRTLIQARNQRLRALADYHQALAEIEALTARPVPLPGRSSPRLGGHTGK